MKKLYLLILLSILLSPAAVFAGNDNPPVGARATGMGNASATVRDQWSLFNNIGGLGGVKQMSVGFAYHNPYSVSALNTAAALFALPMAKYGVAGVGFRRFGNELYSETRVGLGYGHQIGNVSLGIQGNYLQTSIQDLGSKKLFVLDFGGIAEITPQLWLGAHIYNLTQAKLAEYQNERIPTIMKAGLSYRPINKLMINAETEKDIDYPATFKTGIEYEVVKNMMLRTGINTKPFINFFGVGFRPGKFQFDYAVSTHSDLGLSHTLSLGYLIK